jgi:hypothetical protein
LKNKLTAKRLQYGSNYRDLIQSPVSKNIKKEKEERKEGRQSNKERCPYFLNK